MNYTIEKVATLIGAHRYGDRAAIIDHLLTDSRSLCFPETTLFFAIRTKLGDGHRYIADLYRRGVRCFVVEQLPDNWQTDYPEANFLKVIGTREALQRLAERHREEFDIPVVGITGSNGKTIVKEWLYQLLSRGVRRKQRGTKNKVQGAESEVTVVTRSPRSYNSQIGVPLSVWLLNEQTQVGIFEAGISQMGEMQALRSIIQPTIGVLTNLGSAHRENFPSQEAKCKEKLQLFHDTEAVVYPMDDELVWRCVSQYAYRGKQLSWSMRNPRATFYVKEVSLRDTQADIAYLYQGQEGCYTIPFIDEASIQNSITCAVVARYLGVDAEDLATGMAALEPVAMRLEVKAGQHGCTLINDSYNSDINSLDIALDFMNRRPDYHGRKRTLIISDIEQSGKEPHELYHRVVEMAVKRGVERIIGVGPQLLRVTKDLQCLLPGIICFATTEELVASDVFTTLHDEVILIKGARQFGFDRLTDLLAQKVHETTLEVNLGAVVDNLNYYRSLMRPSTKLVCMIKADAYGAGAVEIAKTLQDHRVDYLAVAVADEGVTLRKNGITASIMVMNPEMSSFKTLFDYKLEPEVYSFRLLDALVKAARKEGITDFPVHIKLDTGMHRLGFNVDENSEMPELIRRLKNQQALVPRSVFSHFVGSDSDDFDSFSARQFALFDRASTSLQEAFDYPIIRHIDNSAGIEHFPERQLDMCRLGIGLYGVAPYTPASSFASPHSSLKCVSTLKSTILQLRHVKAGESVGYSRKTILDQDSVIGAIPIGYADGLDRLLGNRQGYCLVNGKKADYVGNICMDVAMIDVTGIDCQEGDSVEIFGSNLPVTALSDTINTIPYEVLTGVSNRVKRIYFQD